MRRKFAPAAILSIVLGAAACVTESEADRRVREDEARYFGDPLSKDAGGPEEPVVFVEFGAAFRLLLQYPGLHPAEGPFEMVFEEEAGRIRLEQPGGEGRGPVTVREVAIPSDFGILNSPGTMTFHRDGRVTWPRPDQTLEHPQATACDLTVRHRPTRWICAYDVIPTPGAVELHLRATEPR